MGINAKHSPKSCQQGKNHWDMGCGYTVIGLTRYLMYLTLPYTVFCYLDMVNWLCMVLPFMAMQAHVI